MSWWGSKLFALAALLACLTLMASCEAITAQTITDTGSASRGNGGRMNWERQGGSFGQDRGHGQDSSNR